MRSKCRLPLGEPPSLCSQRPQSPSALQKLVVGGTGVPVLLSRSLSLSRVSPEVSALAVLHGELCFAPRSRCPPVVPFSEVFRCAQVVPWDFRMFCWEPGRPTVTPGLRGEGAKHFPLALFSYGASAGGKLYPP